MLSGGVIVSRGERMVPSDENSVGKIANHIITIILARATAIIGPPLAAWLFISSYHSLKDDAIAIRADIRSIERNINAVQIENAMHSEQIKGLSLRVERMERVRP